MQAEKAPLEEDPNYPSSSGEYVGTRKKQLIKAKTVYCNGTRTGPTAHALPNPATPTA